MSVIKAIIGIFILLLEIIIPIDTGLTISGGPWGPFFAYQPDTTITFKLKQTGTNHYTGTFACGPSSSDIRYSTSFSKSFSSSADLTLTLPTFSYLSPSGMYCRLNLIEKFSGDAKTVDFTITPATRYNAIDPSSYILKAYSIPNANFSLFNGKILTTPEKFQFPNYLDYFDIDTYYRLDLSGVNFTYTLGTSLSYDSAYLTIYDEEEVFTYLEHDHDEISIPLKIIKYGNYWTFGINSALYVHPKTLQMSFEPRVGFVKTNHFYMPVNHKEYFMNQIMRIDAYHVGVCKSNITWYLAYLASTNMIGACSNSDYCIVGGNTNG